MCISFSKVVLDRTYRGAKLRVFTSERIGMIDYFLLFFGKLMDYEKYPPMHRGHHSLSVLSIDPIYAYHNFVMGNFFGRLKVEMFYGEEKSFKDFDEFKEKLEEHILWYNTKRIKEYLHWKSPIQTLQTSITL